LKGSEHNPESLLFFLSTIDFVGHIRQGFEGRTGEVIALEDADTGFAEPAIFASVFDPFSNNFYGEAVTDLLDAGEDALLDEIPLDVPDQMAIELDVIGLVFHQQFQPGIASPEIVDGGGETELLNGAQVLDQVALLSEALGFEQFEDDVLSGDAAIDGGLEGGSDAEVHFKDALGGQVEVEALGDVEATGEVDGFAAAELIEAMKILAVDLGEDRGGGLSVRATHKGFVGNDLPVADVDNGLKGEAEIKTHFPAGMNEAV
jgi:hypothetical protein